MKHLLPALVLLSLSLSSVAQPVITASNNPVSGDVFIQYDCDTVGRYISAAGPSGASVTWNFSSLTVKAADTLTYMACSATPYCDSFPGADLTSLYSSSDYIYYSIAAAGVKALGDEYPGTITHLTRPCFNLEYPLAYNTTWVDSSIYTQNPVPFNPLDFVQEARIDTFICDGYGTLILPSGTFNNVLRVHDIHYAWDSTWNSPDFLGKIDAYYWYVAGLHNYIFAMNFLPDTLFAYNDQVAYLSQITGGVPLVSHTKPAISVYPNPATDVAHVHFVTTDAPGTSVTITTLTGSIITTISPGNIHNGENDIELPVASLPPGFYLCTLNANGFTTTTKIVICH